MQTIENAVNKEKTWHSQEKTCGLGSYYWPTEGQIKSWERYIYVFQSPTATVSSKNSCKIVPWKKLQLQFVGR